MNERHVKHPFPAVINEKSRILILGSVPSVKSVENNFYYMHPQNRFWKVLGSLFKADLYNFDTETKKTYLLSKNIALYDSVEECDISGSSDNKISNVIPSDIAGLIKQSEIKKIFCNGTASYNLLIKYHPELAAIAKKLPSTSPANAAYNMDKLVSEWKIILN